MNKKEIREKTNHPLSAQEYASMTDEDKKTLREVLVEDGKDPDNEESQMRKLWPKKFIPKELHWRGNEHTL